MIEFVDSFGGFFMHRIKNLVNIAVLIVFISILFCRSVYADVRISNAKLNALKINPKKFNIITLSGDGSVLLCYEKVTDLKLKQKGNVFKLWIIEFLADDRDKVKYSELLLPLTDFQQCCISYDGNTAIITGNRGAKFLKIDIPKKKVSVIFDHIKGKPGFRSHVGIMQYFNNKFYNWGYFYDGKDQVTKKGIALIDLSRKDHEMFELAYDTTEFEKTYWLSRFTTWISPNQCFIMGNKPDEKETTLAYYNQGEIKVVDRAQTFKGGAAASPGGKILYVADRPNGERETLIQDVFHDRSWSLYSENKPFSYLALSANNGETAILSRVDIKNNRMSYFYAMERDGYLIKPITAMLNKPISVMRIAPFGKIYTTFDGSNIYWGKLE